MSKSFTQDVCISDFLQEVDKQYFNGCSLAASIEIAVGSLSSTHEKNVNEWLNKNYTKEVKYA